MKTIRLALAVLGAALLAAACSKSHDHRETSDSGHVHVAPHGGVLIELGDHAYNLELLRDRTAGKLTAWVLDAHAENFVRIAARELAFIAMPGGTYTPIALRAVANPATGETVGDTSQFEFQADWLKTAGAFSGIFTIEIKGTVFKNVAFSLGDGHTGNETSGQACGSGAKPGDMSVFEAHRGTACSAPLRPTRGDRHRMTAPASPSHFDSKNAAS